MCKTGGGNSRVYRDHRFSSHRRRRAICRTLHRSAISVILYNCHDDRATAELTRREYVGTAE